MDQTEKISAKDFNKGKAKISPQSANDLTRSAITYLNSMGFVAWRQNNMGVYDPEKKVFRRNPNNKKGVPDIIGYHKSTGIFLGCEIKTDRDSLSPEQELFLDELRKAKGLAFVARSLEDVMTNVELYKTR